MTRGTERFRAAAAAWLNRRSKLAKPVDPNTEILVLNGSREGLFLAALVAHRYVSARGEAPGLDAEPVLSSLRRRRRLPIASRSRCRRPARTDFCPLAALPHALLARTVAIYLCSPGNPQGAAPSRDRSRA